jgi:hypothetical protein
MTSLFTARRRAEEFAVAVDGHPMNPTPSPEIAELLGVVSALTTQRQALPRPDFAADLRSRLVAEARTVLTPETAGLRLPVRPRGTRERRLVAAASAVVLVAGTASMATAAQTALPGEALYPIKRGIERAETGLTMSPSARGRDMLNQAGDRLSEVQGLLSAGSATSAAQVPHTLQEFTDQARQGSGMLLRSFQENHDPASVARVRTFAARSMGVLEGMAADAPPEAREELSHAAVTLRGIDRQAAVLCVSCAPGLPDLKVPGILLVQARVDRALQEAGVATLDNSHPVVVSGPAGQTDARSGAGQALPGKQAPKPGATSAPSPDELQQGLLPPVPLPDVGNGGQSQESQNGGGPVKDLTDGLGGAVRTILPDTGGLLP